MIYTPTTVLQDKKKKRKKSTESDSSEEWEQESDWAVVCLTEQDWLRLTEKYKESGRKEDRRLYRLLQESFIPEIKEMFRYTIQTRAW